MVADRDATPEPAATLEETLDRYHRLAAQTRNPVYVWAALEAMAWHYAPMDQAIEKPISFPAWIAEYLFGAADLINQLAVGLDYRVETAPLQLSQYSSLEEALGSDEAKQNAKARAIDLDKAMDVVPAALGLRRPGWNSFRSFEATGQKMQEAQAYLAMRRDGISAKAAIDAIAKGIGVSDAGRVHSRIREGKALIDPEEVVKPGG
jgi:hypothetical protein